MYLQRFEILDLDTIQHAGKKFQWNEHKVNELIDKVIPEISEGLSRNQYNGRKVLQNMGNDF
jgi:hypothetical protein